MRAHLCRVRGRLPGPANVVLIEQFEPRVMFHTGNEAVPSAAQADAPQDLSISVISASQVKLSWVDVSGDETAFEVLRMPGGSSYQIVATLPAGTGEYTDSGLQPNFRMFYRVRAITPDGPSAWSGYAHAVLDGVGAPLPQPAPPTGLSASPVPDAPAPTIMLAWTDTSHNETQFVVERRAGADGIFADIATLGPDATTYADADVSINIAYTYRVRSANLIGTSAASDPATAIYVIAVDPPPPPDHDANFTKITWETLGDAPKDKSEALNAVVDGKLYTFGGFGNGDEGPLSRVDVFDPVTERWTRLADMPQRLTHVGTATDGRYVYFAGGYLGTEPTGTHQQFGTKNVWRYDPQTDAYDSLPDLPSRRGGGGMVFLNGELHYLGGNNSDREDVGEHYVLNLNGGTRWTTSAPLPKGRSHMGYTVFAGKIYAIAGQTGNDEGLTTQGDVDVWDPADPTKWTKKSSIPQAVSHISSSTFVMDDRIIVLGGETAHGAAVRTDWAYDPSADEWTELTKLPSARYSGVGAAINGILYYAGGSHDNEMWKGTPGV